MRLKLLKLKAKEPISNGASDNHQERECDACGTLESTGGTINAASCF